MCFYNHRFILIFINKNIFSSSLQFQYATDGIYVSLIGFSNMKITEKNNVEIGSMGERKGLFLFRLLETHDLKIIEGTQCLCLC